MSKTTRNVKTAVKATETVIHGTSGFIGFVWRHRVGLGPVLVGLAVLLTGFLMGVFIETVLYAYGSIFIGTVLTLAWIYFGVSDREGKLHARREQVHFYTVTVASCIWLTLYYRYVIPGTVEFWNAFVILLWLTGLLGAPWWWNLRRRSRVTLENDLDAWPMLTEKTQLLGTWWSGYKKTNTGWTGFLHIPGEMSRKKVIEAAELIEGLTKSPAGSVTVEPAGRNPNLVRVMCIETDPHSDAIAWDGKSLRSIYDEAFLGLYADGKRELTRWFEKGVGGFHRLLGGATRSGKSGLMHLIAALYGPCEDVVLWQIDLKGGTALLPWAPLADWTATTVEEAMFMMMCAAELVDARAAAVARMGKQVAPISSKMPAVILVCDEIASLIGDSSPRRISGPSGAAMVEVGRKGAGMGVFFVLATQYPTLAALKDSQLKSQLTWRACFRLTEKDQGRFILPNMHRGIDPYDIPVDRRGTCYIDAQGVFRPATLRGVYLDTDTQIRPTVMAYWETTPSLDKASLQWRDEELMKVYQNRTIWTPDMLDGLANDEEVAGHDLRDLYDDSDDVDGDGDVDTDDEEAERTGFAAVDETDVDDVHVRHAVTTYAEADAERAIQEAAERRAWLAARSQKPETVARKLMYEALANAGDDGMAPRDLARVCSRTERTIHNWLRDDESTGKVTRLGYGRYALVLSNRE